MRLAGPRVVFASHPHSDDPATALGDSVHQNRADDQRRVLRPDTAPRRTVVGDEHGTVLERILAPLETRSHETVLVRGDVAHTD